MGCRHDAREKVPECASCLAENGCEQIRQHAKLASAPKPDCKTCMASGLRCPRGCGGGVVESTLGSPGRRVQEWLKPPQERPGTDQRSRPGREARRGHPGQRSAAPPQPRRRGRGPSLGVSARAEQGGPAPRLHAGRRRARTRAARGARARPTRGPTGASPTRATRVRNQRRSRQAPRRSKARPHGPLPVGRSGAGWPWHGPPPSRVRLPMLPRQRDAPARASCHARVGGRTGRESSLEPKLEPRLEP